ncbi:MAG: 3-phenylpropionate/cinnamic acid dioxygenase subunit alpha [Chloroflexi bacterium]|nr:3-phenylpropionate/cinnamic acid dioxygenase subunit alpha [Chloroflexota bacterium]
MSRIETDFVRDGGQLISAGIFNDPDVYRQEIERLFPSCWLFVAHESEIPSHGDFVTRQMGDDPVIVSRDTSGHVHVLLNVCRHHGRKVCEEDAGRVARFRCGYHGWTYDSAGKLVAVPFEQAYGDHLDRASNALCEATVDTHRGFIFARWNPGESLAEYLGPMAWVLDLVFGRTDAVEVVGPPIRWLADSNWKLGAANFAGDGYHIFTTHGFSTQMGLHKLNLAEGPRPVSRALSLQNGHGAALVSLPTPDAASRFLGLPEQLWPQIKRNLDALQQELLDSMVLAAGTVFPNLSFLETAGHTPEEWGGPDRPMSFLSLRQWQPRGPDRMEALSWLFMDRDAPDEWKKTSRTCYERVFGVSGTFEQDDVENWAQITRGLRGPWAKRQWLQMKLGLDATPSPDWKGPGDCYMSGFTEESVRGFYRQWLKLVAHDDD